MNTNNLGQIPNMIATSLTLIHAELKKIRETLEKIENNSCSHEKDKK